MSDLRVHELYWPDNGYAGGSKFDDLGTADGAPICVLDGDWRQGDFIVMHKHSAQPAEITTLRVCELGGRHRGEAGIPLRALWVIGSNGSDDVEVIRAWRAGEIIPQPSVRA